VRSTTEAALAAVSALPVAASVDIDAA
jgi:hypothetical protein